MKTALILIAHGSRKKDWLNAFEALAATIQRQSKLPAKDIKLCYMEIAEPSLDSIIEAHQQDYTQFNILPLFMAGGGHVKHDIKANIDALSKKFPSINIHLLPAVGEHPKVIDAMVEIANEAHI